MNFLKAVGCRLLAVSRTRFVGILFSLGALTLTSTLQADTFGSGSNAFDIAFVTIGNPGNLADTTGQPNPAGSVAYSYRIGKYEISEQMIDKANALGGLGITKTGRGPNKPATEVSWNEAAQFVNWLNTSTGHSPAYKFDVEGNFQFWSPSDPGYNSNNQFRNSLAKYFLPSVNEWYKAAYFDPVSGVYYDFPTGSDVAPVSVASGTSPGTAVFRLNSPADITQAGGLSPYGTMAQGGNVGEWNETSFSVVLPIPPNLAARGFRGGDYGGFASVMLSSIIGGVYISTADILQVGFRVASVVPEPGGLKVLGPAFFFWVAFLKNEIRSRKQPGLVR